MSYLQTSYGATNGVDPEIKVQFFTDFSNGQVVVSYVATANGFDKTGSTTLTTVAPVAEVNFNNGQADLTGTFRLDGTIVTFHGNYIWPGKLNIVFDKGLIAFN